MNLNKSAVALPVLEKGLPPEKNQTRIAYFSSALHCMSEYPSVSRHISVYILKA
jgi:hypothetical protein